MKFNTLGRTTAIAAALSAAGMVSAATVDPADFDSIFTEGDRTQTAGLVDVSGKAAVPGNGDVDNFNIPNNGNTLLVGRVSGTDTDRFTATSVTGFATITVLNFLDSTRVGGSPFSATFEFFANGASFGNPGGGSFSFGGENLEVLVTGGGTGTTDFDIGVRIAAVPLPAAGFLLLGALGGMGALRRRK